MLINELTPDNWMFFAIQNYNNPQSVTYSDFEEDLNRIRYIKRLFKRYETTGELKTHLILNHIIVMYNVFDDAASPLSYKRGDVRISKRLCFLKSTTQFIDK